MSLSRNSSLVVYVDSGSVDDSVVLAKKAGAVVVELDLSKPFTAARARNEGVARLRCLLPDVSYIQFVDGDCELHPGWIDAGLNFLDAHGAVGVVSGCLMERFPHRSIYNLLCDIEWDAIGGESKACGGIAMFRVQAFVSVDGFRPELIAGEEPEL
jgi:glycosyltransferase involved in cell wall biosynthesis